MIANGSGANFYIQPWNATTFRIYTFAGTGSNYHQPGHYGFQEGSYLAISVQFILEVP
jgi:hypothetical protein